MTGQLRVLRVVVVDDEEPARLALRDALAQVADVEIAAECANGFDAVKAVSELKPDALVLDVQMPKLDGFDVLELVGADVPVVFVTAFSELLLTGGRLEPAFVVSKPFDEDTLKVTVAQALATYASPDSARGHKAKLLAKLSEITAQTSRSHLRPMTNSG